MRKALRFLTVLVLTTFVVVLMAVPFVVPPVVEGLAVSKLAAFGIDADVRLRLGYCWRNGPGVEGDLRVSVPDAPWRVKAVFGASCGEWFVQASMPKTSFSERDALLRRLLAQHPLPPSVSNLVFSGSVSLKAKVERTFGRPVPVWEVSAPVADVSASLTANGQDIVVDGFNVVPGASGIADHVDIRPMFPRARSVSFGAFSMTNFYAVVRATERSLMANEIGAEFCGGKVNVYSLFLDPSNLNSGFTMFMNDVDAGIVLGKIKRFNGSASGRLHGKVMIFLQRGGRSVHFRDAFLYSSPGEKGKLRMCNAELITDNLAYAGVDAAMRANVADALTDLDYTVLRLDLVRADDGKTARLTLQIRGTATRGATTVPVDLTLNVNGEIEQLINTGLDYSAKMKGKGR